MASAAPALSLLAFVSVAGALLGLFSPHKCLSVGAAAVVMGFGPPLAVCFLAAVTTAVGCPARTKGGAFIFVWTAAVLGYAGAAGVAFGGLHGCSGPFRVALGWVGAFEAALSLAAFYSVICRPAPAEERRPLAGAPSA